MNKTYILSHDIGTSGTKSVLMDREGQIVDSRTVSYETCFPHHGFAEQDPQDWWKAIISNTRTITSQLASEVDIAAIGVSGHMTGLVAVDREGNPIMRGIIHSDFRAHREHEQVKEIIGEDNLYRITGNIPDARSTLCKILWVKNNRIDLFNRTYKFIQSKDYINYRLTEDKFTSDLSDLSHAQLMNIVTKEYDERILSGIGIPLEKMPEIRKSTDVVGCLCPRAAKEMGLTAGIPVVAGAGDGCCSNVGAGIVKSEEAYLSLGTTAWIANIASEPFVDSKRRIFNLVTADGENYGVYGTISAAGRSISWVKDLFEMKGVDELNRAAEVIAKGSEGLIYLPYLEGERSPIMDINAKGTFLGMTPVHRKGHFIRATMEGTSYALLSILEIMRERHEIKTLTAIGGGVNSLLWCRIIADVLNVDLIGTNVRAEDATSLGAALIAGVGAGVYESFDEAVGIINKNPLVKGPDRKDPVYEQMYHIYQQSYPALKEIFYQLSQLY
jgi:xylulokinase